MKPSEYLEKGWTQKAVTRDEYGVELSQKPAAYWCLVGAIEAAKEDSDLGVNTPSELYDALDEAVLRSGWYSCVFWQNHFARKKSEVVGLMQTIERILKI